MKTDRGYSVTVRAMVNEYGPTWEARIKELPDVVEFGRSQEAAYALAIDTIEATADLFQKIGREMPPAFTRVSDEFSGRVTLRMPRALHRSLSETADDEAVSVNQYMVSALSYIVGQGHGRRALLENWISIENPTMHVKKLSRGLVISAVVNEDNNVWCPVAMAAP